MSLDAGCRGLGKAEFVLGHAAQARDSDTPRSLRLCHHVVPAAAGDNVLEWYHSLDAGCFPCFYTLREFVYHGDDAGAQPRALVSSAMGKLQEGFADDMKMATMIMLPQDVLMQVLVPPHLLVPFVSLTGLVWVYLLSSSRGSEGMTAHQLTDE